MRQWLTVILDLMLSTSRDNLLRQDDQLSTVKLERTPRNSLFTHYHYSITLSNHTSIQHNQAINLSFTVIDTIENRQATR
jgi:hypothetical protein